MKPASMEAGERSHLSNSVGWKVFRGSWTALASFDGGRGSGAHLHESWREEAIVKYGRLGVVLWKFDSTCLIRWPVGPFGTLQLPAEGTDLAVPS